MIAAANEPAEPGKNQPQKYAKFNALLLLRALAKALKRRERRNGTANTDASTKDASGRDGTASETTNPTGENMETHKHREKPLKLTEDEREEARKKRRMRDAENTARINRDLEHIMSLATASGSHDDLKALRGRRLALLGEKIDVINEVLPAASKAVRSLPFGARLEKVLKSVLIMEHDEDFWSAIPLLDKMYVRAARALGQDDRKLMQEEALRQLELFDGQ